jgi:CRP-like cAMP-binding protein
MEPLFRNLERFAPFTDEERSALARLQDSPLSRSPARQPIISEGDNPGAVRLVATGWAYRFKDLPDGRRQILGFCLPGDFVALGAATLDEMDHSVGALTALSYHTIRHGDIDRIAQSYPRIAEAFARQEQVGAAIHREWLVNLGRRSAFERLAHLFAELFVRLEVIGMTQGRECRCPLTQNDLADAAGVTSVHLNRTMQEMRREGLVELKSKRLHILDFDRLADVAMFNPAYLRPGRQMRAFA